MPVAIPCLSASRWIDFKGSGRTRPALIACELPDGTEIECVVKLGGHKESSPHQPVCETVAALLAVDLGLPMAEPLLVEITPEFAHQAVPAHQPEARARCEKALGWAFATKHLPPGYSLLPIGKSPARALVPALAELYAFDGLIQNADRVPANANCLIRGNELRIFDHDQAFGFLLDLWGAKPVDEIDSYSFLSRHLAYPHLARDRAHFTRLEGAWQAINTKTVAGYRDLLPDAWSGKKRILHRSRPTLTVSMRNSLPRWMRLLSPYRRPHENRLHLHAPPLRSRRRFRRVRQCRRGIAGAGCPICRRALPRYPRSHQPLFPRHGARGFQVPHALYRTPDR